MGQDQTSSVPVVLDELARRAQGGDSIARNLLWEELREIVDGAVSRRPALPRLWDEEDLRQEAFIVFSEVCARWPGSDALAYFSRV